MPTLELFGPAARDSDGIIGNSSRLVNFYREPIAGGGQAPFILKSVLGMNATFATLGTSLVRAMHLDGGYLYAVAGDALYRVTTGGAVTALGTVSVGGNCTIASNDGKITVAGGGNYYVWNGTTLSQPTATRLTSFNSLAYINGYTILTGPNTSSERNDEFQWSDLLDPTTLDALNFNTADGVDGALIRAAAVNGVLFLFKAGSHEIWQPTGQANANAFSRLAGGVREVGLRSYRLFASFPDGAFFVDRDGRVRVISGIDTVPVSIPAVETAIVQGEPESCFFYADEGHRFLVIRFRDRPSWVFDLDVGEWHERAEGTDFGKWDAMSAAYFNGAWQVGMQDGTIRTLSRSNADGETPLRRTAVSRTIYQDDARFTVPRLQFRGRFGRSDLGRDAKVFIRLSRDNGVTFGPYQETEVGGQGDYDARCIFRRLGQFRSFTVEMNISDEADLSMLADAQVDVA